MSTQNLGYLRTHNNANFIGITNNKVYKILHDDGFRFLINGDYGRSIYISKDCGVTDYLPPDYGYGWAKCKIAGAWGFQKGEITVVDNEKFFMHDTEYFEYIPHPTETVKDEPFIEPPIYESGKEHLSGRIGSRFYWEGKALLVVEHAYVCNAIEQFIQSLAQPEHCEMSGHELAPKDGRFQKVLEQSIADKSLAHQAAKKSGKNIAAERDQPGIDAAIAEEVKRFSEQCKLPDYSPEQVRTQNALALANDAQERATKADGRKW